MNVLRSLAGALALAGMLTIHATAQQPDTVRVTGDRVNLRSAPSVDSGIVRSLAKGTLVTVLTRDNGWAKVKTPTATGWIRGNLLSASASGIGPSASGSSNAAAASAPSRAVAPPSAAAPPPPADNVSRRGAPPSTSSSTPAAAAPPKASSSSSKDGVRFTIFAGLGINEKDEVGTRIAGGFSLLFGVSHLISIGPEVAGFYDHDTIDSQNAFGEIDASGAFLIRAHSSGSARIYVEAGPALLTPVASIVKHDGVSTTSTDTDFQGGVALGAGVQLGPLVLGIHDHIHLASGGGHLLYVTAGLSF